MKYIGKMGDIMENYNEDTKRNDTMQTFQSKSLRLVLVVFYILLGVGVILAINN